ncbi:helix-turn-helix domain-containing protein [Shewanella woodyi]|uniref:Transcriptional regulator, AraC family n=1 Tax=Shewanella woodyi (strain ATCC 51908 / MS32) TaxID=392500 RepID=B1KLN1_SHEWM|nr:AraC family transcriptional regulator [Shewanella woodyi]ACA87328.1 transcriptional regulator, AraC family [Shewanella woodyi ATCC 51908]
MKTVLFNTHDLVLLFTLYQCILFGLCLLTFKKGNKLSHLLLALFLFSYAAIPLDTLINYGEAFRSYALEVSVNLFYLFGYAYWLEAVFLLFYVRSLIYRDFRFKPQDLLFLLPLVLYFFYHLDTWYWLSDNEKMLQLQQNYAGNEAISQRFIGLGRECFRLFCAILCFVELRRYQSRLKDNFANLESVDLNWLAILVIGFLFIRADAILVSLALFSSFEFNHHIDYELLGLISNYTVLILVSVLIFFSLRFQTGLSGIWQQQRTVDSGAKYEKQQPDESSIAQIKAYMQQHKPFLNPLLTLDSLASQLQLSPRVLSQIINRHFEQNFFEFINQYRISESQRLLSDAALKHTTIIEIMDRSGFNSKATFNTLFKKRLGKTPSQYRKQQLQ